MTETPKTLDEHREYLHAIVRIKLVFMHNWLAGHPDEPPVDVLRKRVDIYRKTDANKGLLNPADIDWDAADWQALEQALLACYARHVNDRASFEEEGFAILKDALDARCERDFLDNSRLKGYQCGSLRYNLGTETTGSSVFHIANAIQPRSIFANPHYLPACFLALMEHVEALYGAVEIQTFTWLNTHPKWLALFPQEWQDNLQPPYRDIAWNYGFWGQFISGRGTFNHKVGDHYRRTGEFLYYPRGSHCSIRAMRRHLLERLQGM